jgi:hypothetical protein
MINLLQRLDYLEQYYISSGASQRSALLALGRGRRSRPIGKRLRRENCLKNAATPQRQVHAVLGGNARCFIFVSSIDLLLT